MRTSFALDVEAVEHAVRESQRIDRSERLKASEPSKRRLQVRATACALVAGLVVVIGVLSTQGARPGGQESIAGSRPPRVPPGGVPGVDRSAAAANATPAGPTSTPSAAVLAALHMEIYSAKIALNSVGFARHANVGATVLSPSCGPTVWALISMADEAVVAFGLTRSAGVEGACLLSMRDASRLPPVTSGAASSAQQPLTSGLHRLAVLGVGASTAFRIDPSAFVPALEMALGAIHLARCGVSCHLSDGRDAGAPRDGRGGWHDGTDYTKSSVGAALTIAMLLRSWSDVVGARCARASGAQARMPDELDEVRWGLLWLLEMQDADGQVRHELGPDAPCEMALADNDVSRRSFTAWSVPATAGLVAVASHGARALTGLDDALALRLREAANSSYAALLRAHGGDGGAVGGAWGLEQDLEPTPLDPSAVRHLARSSAGRRLQSTGARIWAAVELFESTGEPAYLRDAEALLAQMPALQADSGSSDDGGEEADLNAALGLLRYLQLSRAGDRDPATVGAVLARFRAIADSLVATSEADLFARPTGNATGWEVHGELARTAMLLAGATRLFGDPSGANDRAAQGAIDYLLGRNARSGSFVTALGRRPPLRPSHWPSEIAGEAWPGLLVGGPNPGALVRRDASRAACARVRIRAAIRSPRAAALPSCCVCRSLVRRMGRCAQQRRVHTVAGQPGLLALGQIGPTGVRLDAAAAVVQTKLILW